MDMELIKKTGISAAEKAAEVLISRFGKISRIQKKGAIDLVTEADTESERIIIQTIRSSFPDHAILAEESGFKAGIGDSCWIIDPLDGTTNFAHQVGQFSVSIAYARHGAIQFGLVLNPINGECFSAVKGQGALLNHQFINVSSAETVSDSLLVTGFPYNKREMIDPLMNRFRNCLKTAQGIRRLGSAALDLCFLACGRFDGYWEQNLNPWDTAAGLLIATEAKAVVTDFSNQPFSIEDKEILATNGKIHLEMLKLLSLKEGK